MKLHFKFVWERFVLVFASRCFSSGATAIKNDRIPMFDVGRSMFEVHKFPFMFRPAAFQAGGWAETLV
jgi:hypothetical protein